MDVEQLRTLVTVVDLGTFDRAAGHLGVTTSAVSQRIKALEREVGRVLVERTQPAGATEAGQQIIRFARQVVELHRDTMAGVGGEAPGRSAVTVAVNADSLATWFTGVLRSAARAWENVELHVFVEDQDHSREMLRSGEVQAAVTTSRVPVAGCRSIPLGSMQYRPVVHPQLLERFSVGGHLDLQRCPVVTYNRKDDVQHAQLRRLGLSAQPPVHAVPSSEGFVRAVRAGLGWAMVPVLQLRPSERPEAQEDPGERAASSSGNGGRRQGLVDLSGTTGLTPTHVPLYLQRWSVRTDGLDLLERAVREAWSSAGA